VTLEYFLSFGRFHIPIFGLFAAAGLICAMMLGQRTARLARLDPDALWDLGMFIVFTAFLLSRALLVLENFRVFLHYPVLVLELPSLTQGGIALTAAVSYLYVRHRHLPLLKVLDALAPCVALVWAFLDLGTFAGGTREGMPTSFPLSTLSAFGRVHPVEIESAIARAVLCGILLWMLLRLRRPGETAAWGLILGGLVLFFTAFLRLPATLYSNAPLDGIQLRALAAIVAGGVLLAWRVGASPHDAGGAPALPPQGVDSAL
jgi:phosphatidylglycerol---prolipoprotein diacylglyceryl transferase